MKFDIGQETIEFFTSIPKALYPHSYHELEKRKIVQAVKYLLSLLFIAYMVMLVLAVPKLINLSNYINTQFPKFEKFDISINIGTKEPIVITDKEPWLVIDTKGNSTNLTYNKLLITDKKIYFKESFNNVMEINFIDYLNILSKKDTIRKIVVFSFYLMIPMIIALLYILSLIKYSLIILAASLLAFVIGRLLKYVVSIRGALVSAAYASTIMILLEIISVPLQIGNLLMITPVYAGISVGIIPLAAFLTIYIIAIIVISEKYGI